MFDTYVLRPGDQHHSHVYSVTEKRAPTDESVKLLKEMEKAAEEKLLGSIRIENCPIDCVIHAMKDSLNLDLNFLVRMKINGKTIDVRHTHRRSHAGTEQDRQQIVDGLVSCVSERIARELLAGAFAKTDLISRGIV